ncbi:DoxX family membrane protein [Candidatus Uhrbacteria bacterium]|nr:DoxX family membrane protein [Candidatus Uhrbacteria bacterium]
MTSLFLLGQIVLGVYFIQAGIMHFMKLPMMTGYATSRKLPAPKLAVVVSGLVLLAGGLGVLFQYQLAWAYGVLAVFLALAALLMHNFWVDQDPSMKMGNMVNFQKNLALAGALFMLLALQG